MRFKIHQILSIILIFSTIIILLNFSSIQYSKLSVPTISTPFKTTSTQSLPVMDYQSKSEIPRITSERANRAIIQITEASYKELSNMSWSSQSYMTYLSTSLITLTFIFILFSIVYTRYGNDVLSTYRKARIIMMWYLVMIIYSIIMILLILSKWSSIYLTLIIYIPILILSLLRLVRVVKVMRWLKNVL